MELWLWSIQCPKSCLCFGTLLWSRRYYHVCEDFLLNITMQFSYSDVLMEELDHKQSFSSVQCSSVTQSYPILRPHEPQHARPPCPSPTPGVRSDSHPSSQWCHPAISSSVVPFSSCPQSLPALGSFPMSQLFAWGGQSIGVSAFSTVYFSIFHSRSTQSKALA